MPHETRGEVVRPCGAAQQAEVLPPRSFREHPAWNARFEVVHGNPGDEELAVVVALLTAAANSATAAPAPEPASNWARTAMRVTCGRTRGLVAVRTASAVIDVSVIVPVFNKGRYLSELLDSLRRQTSDSFECG